MHLIPIMLAITLVTFLLMHISPGDPAERLLMAQGTPVSQEVLEYTRAKMGLDDPFHIQYLNWLKGVFTGEMGTSYMTGRPVVTELALHLPYTILLTISSIALTVLVSIPMGVLAAVRQGKTSDYIIRIAGFIGMAVPGFLLSIIMIYFFSIKLGWLPVIGDYGFKGLIMPSLTLAGAMTGKYIRQVRAVMLDEMEKDYIMGARSRGVKERTILLSNAFKNSMLSIVTMIGLSMGSLLGGTAIVENIFVWPGLGKLVIDAIGYRDYPVIQGYVVWMAVIFVIINLLTDISYRLIDPRIRIDKEVA
ncbi:nickel ABC transporter permease [Alkalibacter mobilis]|uniref:nickel ABC transporter permease n=1 Tax=Alkalibacter mobilis TaxID=2787712 RepID=UPI002FC31808